MDSIDRYDIQEEIGQGGMSVVYRGRDTKLKRPVAIKVLHEHLAKRETSRRRFQREARAVARLDHPNIIDVYDFSDEAEDASYIVMEYIPGRNLREFVDSHRAPPPEIVSLMGVIIADALEHAHEHGVIHRDLKPENIMVTDEGRLTLMDFGIAHVADAETMTQTGSLLGSPAHMAPEIIDGRDVNESSDVFSLGTVLYYLSTGKFPFRGDNPSHLLREIVEGNFREASAVEPKMSRQLDDLINRCLQRHPEDRPVSIGALRESLLQSVETLGPDVSPGEELNKYFQDPESYVSDFEERVVPKLVELGDRCTDAGATSDAFHYFNRVLAYDPSNERVTEALDDLHARQRRPFRTAVGAGIGIGLVAGVVAIAFFADPFDQTTRQSTEQFRNAIDRARARARAAAHGYATSTVTARNTDAITSRMLAEQSAVRLLSRAGGLIDAGATDGEPEPLVSSASVATADRNASDGGNPPDESQLETDAPLARGPDAGSSLAGGPADPDTGTTAEPDASERYTYTFRVLPLAATVFIDGEEYSVPAVHRGIDLAPGSHRIRVESEGCRTYESSFHVDGPSDETRRIVLQWKDAFVTVESDVPAVVYLNGKRSNPVKIGAHGNDARLRIPFGKADAPGSRTRQQVALEVRPRDNMQLVRRQTVTVRPGDSTSLTVNFQNGLE